MDSTGFRTATTAVDGGAEFRVLVADPIDVTGIDSLRDAGCDVDVRTDLSADALREVLPDYDAIVVRSGTTLSGDVIESAQRLSVVGRAGVGVDNIDIEAATRQGVLVTNVPSGNTVAVAEHTLALLFSLARNVPNAHASLSSGEWNKSAFLGTELSGSTLGVVGLGRIGRAVAERADSLGVNVVAYDPYVGEQTAAAVGADLTTFSDLLECADAVSVHVPLTEDTTHLLGAAEFEQMKSGAYLVHAARGGVVDEVALADALESEQLAGAAVDVFENEPPDAENPLLQTDRAIVTPHIAAKTEAAMSTVAREIADRVVTALNGGVPEGALNAQRSDGEVREAVDLATVLGKAASAFAGDAVTAVELSYRGDIAEGDVQPLTAAACVSLLDPILDARVNRVSVRGLLDDRNITVTERTSSHATEFVSEVALTVEMGDDETTVAGTLSQTGEPVLIGIDDYLVTVPVMDHVIVFYGRDEPGVIGDVGTTLADHGVNIAGMYNSREAVGGETVMVVAVDSPVSSAVERELASVENISDVYAADLTLA